MEASVVNSYFTAYGLDPSLQHGALVKVLIDPVLNQILNIEIVGQWTKKSGNALNEHSEPDAVYTLAQTVLKRMSPSSGRLLAIDYDDRAAYWTRRPGQVAKLLLFLGYFIRGVHERSVPVVMVSPAQLRKYLNLKQKDEKHLVHERFIQRVRISGLARQVFDSHEDVKDAAIIAYMAAMTSRENLDVSRPTQTYLPGSRTPTRDAIETTDQVAPPGGSHR